MTLPILDALLRLWNHPLPADDSEAQAAVRAVYTDPVTINGLSLDLGQLVGLARAAQATYGDAERRIELRIIDILTLVDGRISNVWMTADELGVLANVDAITIVA